MQINQYFVNILRELLDFYSKNMKIKQYLKINLESLNPSMLYFMEACYVSRTAKILLRQKNKTCFKGADSCIDLMLTHRKHYFKKTSSYETEPSDCHHLIYSVMKTTFKYEKPKKIIYRNYSIFLRKISRMNYYWKFVTETIIT